MNINSKSFTIHDLPKAERPRERLQRLGAEALSSQELLVLILGRGIRGESVMVTAQRLLSSFGNAQRISQASLEELSAIRGVGPAKAAQLKAAFELAKRKDEGMVEKISLKASGDIVKLVRPRLKDKKKEHFIIACLDTRNCINRVSDISIGALDANYVHPREVFKEAIQSLAAAIILVHNHPSGDPEPSEDDLVITRRLIESGKIIGIEVKDHIIVTGKSHFSFKENNLI